MMGINVNDKSQPYTAQILDGLKTIETRRPKSLHPYIGERIGIVRTGLGKGTKATLVGYATVGEPIWYGTPEEFAADYDRHLVAAGSKHDCDSRGKWGYPLIDVEACEPRMVTSLGIVARKL